MKYFLSSILVVIFFSLISYPIITPNDVFIKEDDQYTYYREYRWWGLDSCENKYCKTMYYDGIITNKRFESHLIGGKSKHWENMIERIPYAECFIGKMCAEYISEYCNTSKGYYHPLCDPGLYDLKEKFMTDLCHTRWGKEYCQNGIIQTNIMDGYDAGWLSPEGEFYGGNGETSNLIHMNIAENIFHGNNKYAIEMSNDGVSKFSSNSPEEWLQKMVGLKFIMMKFMEASLVQEIQTSVQRISHIIIVLRQFRYK